MIKKIKKRDLREYIIGYTFLCPAIIIISLFVLYPMIRSLSLSFFKWNGVGRLEFIGMVNYINMFTRDPLFYTALKNSAIFTFGATICTVGLGFILAVIIDLKIRFSKVYRFVFFLPYVYSVVVVSLLWRKVFESNGLANFIFEKLNLDSVGWFSEPALAMGIILFVTTWQFASVPMILFLAGLSNIDENIYEAAKIDGASTIRRIFSIIIPMLRNVFTVIIMIQIIYSFKVFDIIYVMTRGGPGGSTEVLGTLIYKYAFKHSNFGNASVVSVVVFIVAIIFAVIYIRMSGFKETIRGN